MHACLHTYIHTYVFIYLLCSQPTIGNRMSEASGPGLTRYLFVRPLLVFFFQQPLLVNSAIFIPQPGHENCDQQTGGANVGVEIRIFHLDDVRYVQVTEVMRPQYIMMFLKIV